MNYLKSVFAIVLLASCFSRVEADPPTISLSKSGYSILLSQKMRNALRQYDPNFVPWQSSDYLPSLIHLYSLSARQAPSCVIGDFNSDGTLDTVLAGHNRTHNVLACILWMAEDFKVVEVEKGEKTDPKQSRYDNEEGLWVYLTYVPRGRIKSPYEPKPLELKADAFEISYYEKASVLYYFWDGKFSRYSTSD